MKNKFLIFIFTIFVGLFAFANVEAQEANVPTPKFISASRLTDTSAVLKYKLDSCSLNNCGILIVNETLLKEKSDNAIVMRSKNDEEYIWQNLEKGKTYKFYIAVYWIDSTGFNNGNWVGPKSVTTSSSGLSNTTVSISNYETVKIKYNAGSDVKSVKVTNLSVKPNKTKVDNNLTGVKFTKLVPGRTYKFKIVPIMTNGKAGTAVTKTVSLKLKNTTFSKLSRYSYNKVKITFKKPNTFTGIQIENMTTGKRTYSIKNTTAIVSGLTYNKSYKFRIRTIYVASTGKYYYGSWSSPKKIKVLLQTPTNFNVTSSEAGKAVLTYSLARPRTGVEVYNVTNGTRTKRSYTQKTIFYDLVKGATYTFKIRTYYKTLSGKYYYSAYTSAKSVKIADVNKAPVDSVETSLPVPTSVTVLRNDYNKIRVGYTISSPSLVDGVEIYNLTSGITRTGITNKEYYIYDKLTYNTSYRFMVRTYKVVSNVKKYSAWSSVSKEIVAKLPTIPNLAGVNTQEGGVKFTYTPSGSVTGVEIQDITTSRETGKKIKTYYQNSYTWKGLSNGLHKFRIRSFYKAGQNTYYSYWSTSFTNQSDGIAVTVTGSGITCSLSFTNAKSNSIKWCTYTEAINVTGVCTSSSNTISKDNIHINCGSDKCLSSIEKTGGKTAKVVAKIKNTNGNRNNQRFNIKVYATDGSGSSNSITKLVGFSNCSEDIVYWK